MQFDHLNFNEDDGLMPIEDFKALHLQKRKLKVKRQPGNISYLNQKYRKMITQKRNDFLRHMNPFRKS